MRIGRASSCQVQEECAYLSSRKILILVSHSEARESALHDRDHGEWQRMVFRFFFWLARVAIPHKATVKSDRTPGRGREG